MNPKTDRIPWGRLGTQLLIIVTGVLLALAAESWWAGRGDARAAQQYLGALEDDLRTDSVFYAEVALPRMVRKREALDVIGPVVRGVAPVPSDTLAFLTEVGLGGLFGIPGGLILAETTTIDELIATGALSLLESAELRASLIRYYSGSAAISARSRALMANYPFHVHGASPAELRDARTEADVRAWGVGGALGQFITPEFERIMNQEYNYMLFMNREMVLLSEELNHVLLQVRCARRQGDACREFEGLSSR